MSCSEVFRGQSIRSCRKHLLQQQASGTASTAHTARGRKFHRPAANQINSFRSRPQSEIGYGPNRRNNWKRISPLWFLIPTSALAGYALHSYRKDSFWNPLNIIYLPEAHAEAPEPQIEIPVKKGTTKDENRNLISSQHVQVRRSWENPGVYAWGSNSSKVAAPGCDEQFIKTPRRIPFFDDVLLRDVKLDRHFGVAIDERGDLLQWGDGYASDIKEPTKTLKGKNLTSLAISRDRIVALSSGGTVYSIPASREIQQTGRKVHESWSWLPFWTSSAASVSYRLLAIPSPSWREQITQISSGLEHVLLLTSSGRVFSSASGSEHYPERGQLGIPGLSWTTRPSGPLDQPHELTTLRGFDISSIATGDYHSLCLDSAGRVFAFGDNTYGQLGFDYTPTTPEAAYVDAPSLLPTQRLYPSASGQQVTITKIFAGGNNSFFAIDAASTISPPNSTSLAPKTRTTADLWAAGRGTQGALGIGRWTHSQSPPAKLKPLSGLAEWDERLSLAVPIRTAYVSIGATHVAAVLANETRVSYQTGGRRGTANDTNWGADILFWGANEFFQLGTGKRNNAATPMYIAPLDGEEEEKSLGRSRQEHRFQITPRSKIDVRGRKVSVEQRVECGRHVTAVYSGV